METPNGPKVCTPWRESGVHCGCGGTILACEEVVGDHYHVRCNNCEYVAIGYPKRTRKAALGGA